MTDINELMDRDPLDLTEDELDQMIAHFKESLKIWHHEKQTKKKGKRAAPQTAVNLDDLGL